MQEIVQSVGATRSRGQGYGDRGHLCKGDRGHDFTSNVNDIKFLTPLT